MPRRKLQERNVRKIGKIGNGSWFITLPLELVKKLGWREKQKVVAKKSGKGISIKDWKKKKTKKR